MGRAVHDKYAAEPITRLGQLFSVLLVFGSFAWFCSFLAGGSKQMSGLITTDSYHKGGFRFLVSLRFLPPPPPNAVQEPSYTSNIGP